MGKVISLVAHFPSINGPSEMFLAPNYRKKKKVIKKKKNFFKIFTSRIKSAHVYKPSNFNNDKAFCSDFNTAIKHSQLAYFLK